MTREQWNALAKRCEEATGPDREADYRMAYALGWRFNGFESQHQKRDQPTLSDWQFSRLSETAGSWMPPGQLEWPDPGRKPEEPDFWTLSIDAITALIDKELPGWRVRWHTDGDGVHEVFVENKGDFGAIDARHTDSFAATPALALCAAFCRAMAERCEQ